MYHRILNKMLRRDIAGSLGRYVAIVIIIMLGVIIFTGVKGIGPGYTDTATALLDRTHLADVTLTSTAGLTDADITQARKVRGAQIQGNKTLYALAQKDESVVLLNGYRNHRGLNRLVVRSGHLPQAPNQIVLDQRAKKYGGYKLGATYRLAKTDHLTRRTYTVVGFVDSPEFINSTTTRGAAVIGNGSVAYFAYVPQVNMDLNVYTSISFYFKQLAGGDSFSDRYAMAAKAKVAAVKRLFKQRAAERRTELQAAATKTLTKQVTALKAAQAQLDAGTAQLQAASGGAITTTAALTRQQAQLDAAGTKLQAAQAQVAAIATPKLSYTKRGDLMGFTDYGDSAERIAAIGNVFPVFFFLIAALITFTTVSRMIAENRTQLGTMKALGYGKAAIARNYYIYAFSAGIIGTVVGSAVGSELLPRFVLAISTVNIFTEPVIKLQWLNIGLATLMALLATVGAVIISTGQELREGPAALMLPKTPKIGKRILLERITPLWRRLSFNQKVSYRNLFRFKARMMMTIIGIAGGAGLIVTGFGLQNSIGGTANAQFHGILQYAAVVRLQDDATTTAARRVLGANAQYKSSLDVASDVLSVQKGGKTVNAVNLMVPTHRASLHNYVNVVTPKAKAIKLAPAGIVLTKNAAAALNVTAGARVNIKTAAGKEARVKVTAVADNYTGHFAYMSHAAYRAAFTQAPTTNALLVRTSTQTTGQEQAMSKRLLRAGDALNTTFISTQRKTLEKMSGSLNSIIIIMVVMSGVLSFVVLYNLTNINVSERMRELSTIKVLGFYNGEVTMYIVRENIVLTLIGIVAGFGVGRILTAYILNQASAEQATFPLIIHWVGYAMAAVLTAVFTAIVMWVTHRRLKAVDMLEALKARE